MGGLRREEVCVYLEEQNEGGRVGGWVEKRGGMCLSI